MTKKPTSKKSSNINSNEQFDRRTEWRLELPLTATVEGKLPHGKTFKEETTLENISSTGAYFSLNSKITVGSKLNLLIELPSNLTEGKKLKLCLGGKTVRLQKIDKSEKKQGVALHFDEEFKSEEFQITAK